MKLYLACTVAFASSVMADYGDCYDAKTSGAQKTCNDDCFGTCYYEYEGGGRYQWCCPTEYAASSSSSSSNLRGSSATATPPAQVAPVPVAPAENLSATPMPNCVIGEDYIALQKCYESCLVPCALKWDPYLNVYESCCSMPGKKFAEVAETPPIVSKTQCGFWEAASCKLACSTDCYKHIDEKTQQLEYCCGTFTGDDDNSIEFM